MEGKESRLQGGALTPKFLNPKKRSRNKFGMTKRPEPNPHVMLNLFQHLVCFFSAFSRRIFHPRPQDGVFKRNLNNEFLSERNDAVKRDPFHPPGEGSSPESGGLTIPLRRESGNGQTVFVGVE